MCNTYGDDNEKRERRRRQRQKCFGIVKKIIASLFSHIGLSGMVVAYSIMGGFLFQALEAPYEHDEKLRILAWKEDQINEILKLSVHLSLNLNEQGKVNFTERLRAIFVEFQTEVTIAVKEKGWDGRDDTDRSALQWSFAGALLYAVTVITTIGYGHIAPKTGWGRLVTILYALVGIPLTFLYLSNIGNVLADSFRLFYKKICCDLCCCQKCERKRKHERLRAKRRKELAAQRNTLLKQVSVPANMAYEQQFQIQDETSNGESRDNEEDAISEDGTTHSMNIQNPQEPKLNNLDKSGPNTGAFSLKGGSPLGPDDGVLDGEDSNHSNDMYDASAKETEILDDVIESSDDVRETAILDDNTDDDNLSTTLPVRKPSLKKDIDGLNLPSSKSKMDGIYNQLVDVKETAILDDSDTDDSDDNDVFVDSEEGKEQTIGLLNSDGENGTVESKSKLSKAKKKKVPTATLR